MKILTLIANHDAHERKNTLIEISMTRVLTEKEREELDQLIGEIDEFEEGLL